MSCDLQFKLISEFDISVCISDKINIGFMQL